MKTILGMILFAVAILSFVAPQQTDSKYVSQPEQQEGIYIYYRSKPIKETEYIATHSFSVIWKEKPELMIDKLIKEVKKKYPTCQAIIVAPDMYKCDVVKFK